MEKEFITGNFKETQKLGKSLALEIGNELQGPALSSIARSQSPILGGAFVFCLEGDLGAGKTTFTQGVLKGLGAEGPYTSPTFLIMKEYNLQDTKYKKQETKKFKIRNIYHIDAYRVGAEDVLSLGWEEIIADPKNVVIVEWPEKIARILPENSIRIKFEWLDENQRKITFGK
ncbi:MAG: tRNA (adenosine(37)-N6)-threonylcarbamoyltransferase complex ATPase subunit type 1 TsaE [Candidatus Moranbacteria bacterium]|nr:tRNA (adenosine(37)-N6)-threonylcarbamoyltransferase complex ATPase subunit type 1 TsaE [Candidatus Moranbacteria bacterium]